MFKTKRFVTIIVVFIICLFLMCSTVLAQTLSIRYESIDGRFMWATSPEWVKSSNPEYVYGCSVNTDKYLDVEIYNHNDTLVNTLRFGVVVYNNNYSSITLDIAGKAITTYNFLSGNEESKLSSIVYNVILPFKKGQGSGTITIPPRSAKFVMYSDVKPGYLVNGRISMKSSKSNVYARVVHGPISTNPSYYFSLTELEYGTDFCGILSYIGKKATIQNANVGDTFNLFEHPIKNNIGEYDGVESYKSGGHDHALGNFSIVYDLTFEGASGKTLKITHPVGGRILFNTDGTWYSTNYITSNKSWKIPLGSDANVQLLLPSGNCSNLKAELIN